MLECLSTNRNADGDPKGRMNYYYAVSGQQTGPIEEEQLRQMVAAGTLPAQTPIWRDGMPDWQPFAAVLGGVAGGAAIVECGVCHRTFPADQTIRYGAVNVCAECKPQFMQGLREGTTTGAVALEFVGFGARFGAKIIDWVLMWAVGAVINMIFYGSIMGPTNPAQVSFPTMGLVTLLNFLIPLIYQTAFLYWRGQTIGKMALGIKVVTPEGAGLGLGKCIGRPLAEILSGCLLLIGYLMVLWDPEKRALHDRLAGTRVIKVRK